MRITSQTKLLGIGSVLALIGVALSALLLARFGDVYAACGDALLPVTRAVLQSQGLLWLLPLLPVVLATGVRSRGEDDRRRGVLALVLGALIGLMTPILCLLAMYASLFPFIERVE